MAGIIISFTISLIISIAWGIGISQEEKHDNEDL
jgi:hypothetical protein